MSSIASWMKFFPADWSASVKPMPLAARGAYLELLCYAWQAGGLPSDLPALARIVGVSEEEFTPLWESWLVTKFVPDNAGKLVNPRQEEVRAGQEKRVTQRRRAAEARWSKATDAKPMRKPCETPCETDEGQGQDQGQVQSSSSSGDLLWRTCGELLPAKAVNELAAVVDGWMASGHSTEAVERYLEALVKRCRSAKSPRGLFLKVMREDEPVEIAAPATPGYLKEWSLARYEEESA